MMKFRLTFYLLIWISILLLSVPFLKNEYLAYQTTKYDVTQYTNQELANNEKKAISGSPEISSLAAIQPPSVTGISKSLIYDYSEEVIGGISIPSLAIQLPILQKITNENLYVGAAPVISNQKMGEGNYSLAAHHIHREKAFFGPLMNAKKGEKIYLQNATYQYIYQIATVKVVPETDTSVLKQTNKPTLTLITCDKPTTTTNRLIVTAELVQKQVLTQASKSEVVFSEKPIPLFNFWNIIIGAGIIFVMGLLVMIIWKKSKKY
ncbi:class A sortase [Listeria seeligeri]|uniref:class A sortase n=1 Tax=Listeria seeligeri TaxID=1640 RepID=UPI0010DF8B95|nr:class A sortase [Listeria seeligeri]MBC1538925.1 class A sortase [Listeria seeligeri]MBC1556541.1 class A sortase [Listeria seeligeri]MBC1730891.1 class A sortase [Listeria seeligeri]MBC1808692.1 class A sortase [Listeria seeligeri]MBC1895115.1 class A sortase [Listeria seeligeri]